VLQEQTPATVASEFLQRPRAKAVLHVLLHRYRVMQMLSGERVDLNNPSQFFSHWWKEVK